MGYFKETAINAFCTGNEISPKAIEPESRILVQDEKATPTQRFGELILRSLLDELNASRCLKKVGINRGCNLSQLCE